MAHLDAPPLRVMSRFPEGESTDKKDFMKYSPHRHIQRLRSGSSLRESSFHKEVGLGRTGSRSRHHNLSSHEVFATRPYTSKFGKLYSECESKQAVEPRGMQLDPSSSDFESKLHHRKLVS